MHLPDVIVSILAYRSRSTIEECLRSVVRSAYSGRMEVHLRAQGDDPVELRLTQTLAAELTSDGRPVILSSGPNIGFAAGHNAAIAASRAELVCVLNADAKLHPRFLDHAVDAFRDPSVGAVQGKVLRWVEGGPPVIDSAGLVPLRSRRVVSRGQGEPDSGQYADATEIFGAEGACAVFRRAALDDTAVPRSVGSPGRCGAEIFDEDFFAFKEDVDLAWRLQWRGWRTIYEPSALAWHRRGSKETAAGHWVRLLGERRRMPGESRLYGFSNHRLMQLKNERLRALVADVIWWAGRETLAWPVALASREGIGSFLRLARLTPRMVRKRRWVQQRRQGNADPYRWFVATPSGPAPARSR